MSRHPLLRYAWHALVVLAGVACFDVSAPASTDLAAATGLWVFHVESGPFADHVQLLEISQANDLVSPLRLRSLPTRDWTGQSVVDLNVATAFGRGDAQGISWTLILGSGEILRMHYVLVSDTAAGSLEETRGADSGIAIPVQGVRIAAPLWLQSGASGDSVLSAHGPPVVLLRLDDDPPSDPLFIAKMRARSLYGELAIPTRWVGTAGRPSWQDLRDLVASGFSVAAHSRTHGTLSGSSTAFMGEVLGSIEDLASEQLPTTVFVQPGTWTDSLYFGSSQQFHGWRGALFRTFTRITEAYAYSGSVQLPLADSLRLGLGHYTISNKPPAWVLGWWAQAVSTPQVTVFMVHTWALESPDTLDWFLDSLGTAVRAGRIRLAHSSAELFPPDPGSVSAPSAVGPSRGFRE